MKKVLIIEDKLAYLKLLHTWLTKKSYKVIEALDGEEGLKLAKKEKPDLILLDIRLLVIGGMAMLGLLRREMLCKSIKVIILADLVPTNKMIAQIMRDKPAYCYVRSHIKFEDLLNKIKELLAE